MRSSTCFWWRGLWNGPRRRCTISALLYADESALRALSPPQYVRRGGHVERPGGCRRGLHAHGAYTSDGARPAASHRPERHVPRRRHRSVQRLAAFRRRRHSAHRDGGAAADLSCRSGTGGISRDVGFRKRRARRLCRAPYRLPERYSGYLVVPAISVQGVDSRLAGPPPSGQAIAPGQGGEFTIVFTPQAIGVRQGSITLGDRNLPVARHGSRSAAAGAYGRLDLKQAASAQQGAMIVRFDAPAQTSGTGTATLDFRGPADTAIGFAAGGRSVTFPIAPGDAGHPAFPDRDQRRRAHLHRTDRRTSDQQSVTIAGGPPGIATVQGVRSAGVSRDPHYGLRQHTHPGKRCRLRFTMPPATSIAPGTLRVDAASDFARYFAGSDLGGVFLLRAVFPVTGDAAVIAACEATLTNTSGSSSTQRTYF